MWYPFKKIVQDCQQATLLSLKKEEGKITISGRVKLFYHLLYCSFCRRFVKQSKIINECAHQYHDNLLQHPSHQLSANTRQTIQQKMDELQAE